jgi:hypothetical protein
MYSINEIMCLAGHVVLAMPLENSQHDALRKAARYSTFSTTVIYQKTSSTQPPLLDGVITINVSVVAVDYPEAIIRRPTDVLLFSIYNIMEIGEWTKKQNIAQRTPKVTKT